MTEIHALYDHSCPGLEELVKQGIFYFEGFGCWCSPIERHYYLDWGEKKRYYVRYCPCCGQPIIDMYKAWIPAHCFTNFDAIAFRKISEGGVGLYGKVTM